MPARPRSALTTRPSARRRLSARCRCGSVVPRNGCCSPGWKQPARCTKRLSRGGAPTRAAGARVQSLPAREIAAPDDPARKERFREARAQHGFSEYALHDYAQQFGHSWLGDHLDSLTIQALATRAYRAANRLLVGKARRVRFKGRHQLDTVEGKTNTSGPRWRGTRVEWKGLELEALLDPHDPVQAHGLACPVKYVRLVRRKLGERNRFSAQLVCEGVPYQKPQHHLGSGIVGLDLGPSTIAVVSAQAALLQAFCPEVAPDTRALRRLDRKLDRQRRANNPANYDERGRVKRGKQRWKVSKRQRRVLARRREVYRKLAATRKRSHGQLAHRVLGMGSTFQLEYLSYRAWQKTYGKSVQRCAPGMLVERLSRLAASAGGTVVLINAWRAPDSPNRATVVASRRRRAHSAGTPVPVGPAPSAISSRPLWHVVLTQRRPCSMWVGRHAAWPGWEPTLQAAYEQAISNQPARGRQKPAAFGRPPADPSQSRVACRRVASRA